MRAAETEQHPPFITGVLNLFSFSAVLRVGFLCLCQGSGIVERMIDPKDDRDKFGRGSGPSKQGPDLRAGDDPRWASLRYDGSPGATEVGLKDRAQRLGWPTIGLELKKPKAKSVSRASAPSCACQCRCDDDGAPSEDVAASAGGESTVDGGGLVDLDPFALDGGKTGGQVLAEARAAVEAAVDALLALDVASADGAAIRSHAVGMQRVVNKTQARSEERRGGRESGERGGAGQQ